MDQVNPDPDFGVLLNVAGVVFAEKLHAHMEAAGFTGYTFRTGWVIRAVGEDRVPLRELADRMGLSSPGTLKAIDPMVSQGLLERGPMADRRVRAVQVTDRGREALAEARRFHRLFEEELAAELDPESVAGTRRVLNAILAGNQGRLPGGLVDRTD